MLGRLKFILLLAMMLCLPLKSFAQISAAEDGNLNSGKVLAAESEKYVETRVHEVIGNELQAASTDCTDGTQFFAVRQGLADGTAASNGASVYLLRNGKLLYSEYTDFSVVGPIMCLKQAIIYIGDEVVVNALHYENGAVASVYDKAWPNGGIPYGEISSNAKRITVTRYGDGKYYPENEVTKFTLDKPLHIPDKEDAEIIPVDTMYKDPLNEGMVHPVKITTMGYCDNVNWYFAYLDENDQPRLAKSGDRTEFNSTPLPFVATNSFCIDRKAYIFGKENGKLRGGKIFFDSKIGALAFKPVPLSKIPLKPYI